MGQRLRPERSFEMRRVVLSKVEGRGAASLRQGHGVVSPQRTKDVRGGGGPRAR